MTGAAPDLIRSSRFRAEREAAWHALEALLTRAEAGGPRALSYEEAGELSSLYQQAISSLSLARAISMDRALESYLEALCARAYLVVYAPQETLRGLMSRLLGRTIPRAVRRSALPLAIGFLAMWLGALVGWLLFQQDNSWFFTFVPGGLADGRAPGASVEYLRDTLFSDHSNADGLGAFSAFLFTHNTRIAIFVFALGVFAALPSFLLTFYNGLMLGAFFALFAQAGLGVEAFGWLSIHGVTELSAISIACAGGARLGLAVLLPGARSRRAALAHAGRDAVALIILAGLMLIAAGLIEGFLRQLIQSTPARLIIGWGIGAGWLGWLGWLMLAGRSDAAGGADGP